jgi:hypothetical protein
MQGGSRMLSGWKPSRWAVSRLDWHRTCASWVLPARGTAERARPLSSPAGGGRLDPTKDPAIAAAIEKERAARLAAQPAKKLGRSLTETLSDHRDELVNIFLAALLLVLTLKMLREKGEKLDEESDRDKRIKVLEAELASLEAAIVERVHEVDVLALHCHSALKISARRLTRVSLAGNAQGGWFRLWGQPHRGGASGAASRSRRYPGCQGPPGQL